MYLERQWFHDDHLVNQRVVQHHYTFLPPEPCQEPWPRNALKTCSLAGDGKRAEMARQSNVQQPFLSKKKTTSCAMLIEAGPKTHIFFLAPTPQRWLEDFRWGWQGMSVRAIRASLQYGSSSFNYVWVSCRQTRQTRAQEQACDQIMREVAVCCPSTAFVYAP
jgi:hypothetical protein